MVTMRNTPTLDFLVEKKDLRNAKFVPAPAPDRVELGKGQALLAIDKFAFTSNNVTYALAGDMLNYWGFFPAPEGWGRVPVWGFGDVVRSNHPSVKVGERYFGYFPMSSYLVVEADKVGETGFVDVIAHRKGPHPAYNQYTRTSTDPTYDVRYEDQQMLLRPLFMTSWLIEDFLTDNQFFGARTVVISSASAKTSFGLAYLLNKNRPIRGEIVGLTSPSNADFVRSMGTYDRVELYDRIDRLPREPQVVFVDIAGDPAVRRAVHHHYRDNLKHSCLVGGTHWENARFSSEETLPGAKPQGFFAPGVIEKRVKEWGPGGVQERFAKVWREFMGPVSGWIKVSQLRGAADVEQVYRDMLEARARPDIGYVLGV